MYYSAIETFQKCGGITLKQKLRVDIPLAHDQVDDDAIKKAFFPLEIRQRIRQLQSRNNWYNFFAIALDWVIVGAAITLVNIVPSIWTYIVAIFFIGSRMRGLDNLMHEASHAMLFKNRILNKWMACIFAAFPVFTSYTTYCLSHYDHHRDLWGKKDPDARRYKLVKLDQPTESAWQFILLHIVRPMFLIHVPQYVYGTLKVNLISKKEPISERVARFGFWFIIIVSSILFGWWKELILFWAIPWLTTFQILRYWAEMAEHAGLKTRRALYASRNSFDNPLERLFLHPHHDTYHLVHHLFPAVPHYNMRKAHLVLMEYPEYRDAHHCVGFFKSFVPGLRSVVDDIRGRVLSKGKLGTDEE